MVQYDAAGNVVRDNLNQYLYDGEGRLCAVQNLLVGVMTQYIYDADGRRVAKGSISSWSCDLNINPTTGKPNNGFTPSNLYVIGPSGEQLTETDGQGNWLHTNVYAAGSLIATYDMPPTGDLALHFQLEDWLGTRRVQTDIAGNVEETYASMPYGDGLTPSMPAGAPPTADDATENHFTGKEHDSESNLEYFGARYYASSMGRWMSPDWSAKASPVPFASFSDPQSLNLYNYARNNPLSNTDADGHCDIGCQIGIVMGIVHGIQRDGSVGAYTKNVGIGVLKGAGRAVVNTAKLAAAGTNPGALAAAMLSPGPPALQASNTTQAQASMITQVALPAAAGMAAGPLLGAVGAEEAGAATVMTGTRYVGAGEAAFIESARTIPITDAAGAAKQFFYTPEDPMSSASAAQAAYNLPNTPSAVATFDASGLNNSYGGNVDGGTGIELIGQPTQPIPATSLTPLKP